MGPLACNEPDCRGYIRSADFPKLVPKWDAMLKPALMKYFDVAQPLSWLVPDDEVADIKRFVQTGSQGYRSVARARIAETLLRQHELTEPRHKT